MKTPSFKTGILTVFAICFCAFLSTAQENVEDKKGNKKRTFEQVLEKMDANEDGKLSKDEVKGKLKDHFDAADSDEDGFITKEEFDNMPKPKKGKRGSRGNN